MSRTLRVLVAVVAVGLLIAAIADQWQSVSPRLKQVSAGSVAGALAAVMIGMFAMLKSWQTALIGLGSPVSVVEAARIFFIGQIGKYVPGAVWPVLMQAELGRDAGVPRTSSVVTLLYIYVMYPVTAVLVGCATLPWTTPWISSWLYVAAAAGCLVVLAPPVLNRVLRTGLRLLRQRSGMAFDAGVVVRSSAWAVLMWLAFGAQAAILCESLGHDMTPGLALTCVGGFAVAWACGFVAVLAPAGGGVRELALVALLSHAVGARDALAVAVLSRLLTTVADLLCALVGFATLGPRRQARIRRGSPARGGRVG